MAYTGIVTLDGNDYLVGSTMYGICTDTASTSNKTVNTGTLGLQFDELIPGISVMILFVNGNAEETISLQIGSTERMNVLGNCKCGLNAILQFTYGTVNNNGMWILNVGEKVAVNVLNYYDSSSSEPISGQGVADAIAPLIPGHDNPASLGVDTTIPANPTNDKVPTSLAVANYVLNSFSNIDAFVLKGTFGTNGTISTIPSAGYSAGDVYRIITAGTYLNLSCNVNDLLVAIIDANQWQVNANSSHWIIIKTNRPESVTISGNVIRGNIAVLNDDTTIVDGGVTVETSVPLNAVFTDTHYEAAGTINAVTSIEKGNDFILTSVSSGCLHLNSGIKLNKNSAITGILEVT